MDKIKVLISIDEPELAELIVKMACLVINREIAEITLLNVLETTLAEEELFLRHPDRFIEHESKKSVFSKVELMLEEKGFVYKKTRFEEGSAAKQILKISNDENFDLIVIGSTNKNVLEKILLGSTSYKVVRESKIPVLIIKPDLSIKHKNIKENFNVLFATDGSSFAQDAAVGIKNYLDYKRADVTVVNVRVPLENILPQDAYAYADISKILKESELVSQENVRDAAIALAQNRFNVVDKHYLEGDPATEIIKDAHNNNYDLIVLGSHGKNEFSNFLMGSVSTKVYENSSRSVFIYKKR